MSGNLYVVATPIGNIQDITLRAIDTLRSVDLIACEDTRHSRILFNKHDIKTSSTSYHKFNIIAKTKQLIEQIKAGKNIALVSDAGVPGISDPGQELIKAAVDENIKIEVIPGPSAAISALSVSGLKTDKFVFEGFLAAKSSERSKRLNSLKNEARTIILYEAPHRLVGCLNDIQALLGDRNICIAREMTKKFEEITRGKTSDLIEKFTQKTPKGEIVIVIEGKKEPFDSAQDKLEAGEEIKELLKDIVAAGVLKSEAVKIVAKRLNIPKNKLYRAAIDD